MKIIIEFQAIEDREKVKQINQLIEDLIQALKRKGINPSLYNKLVVPNIVKGGYHNNGYFKN